MVEGIAFKRVALLKEHIAEYHLPHSPEALKKTDSRAYKHIAEYGELAVELDALRPDILEALIKEAIEEEIDIDLFGSEQETQEQENIKLNRLKLHIGEQAQMFLSNT